MTSLYCIVQGTIYSQYLVIIYKGEYENTYFESLCCIPETNKIL